MESVELASGHAMPMLGMGTWPMKGEECTGAVLTALEVGYVHFDTAWMYKNHDAIGEALKRSGVDRSGLFLTSKVWNTHLHYDGVREQMEETLRDLKTDYVDLFLIHWPNDEVPLEETFRALGELAEEGKARSIGVSNFDIPRLEKAQSVSDAPVCVNQIKYNPGAQQPDVLAWCKQNGVAVTAYSPLAKANAPDNPALLDVAREHGRTPVQTTLRWLIQLGIIVIPKASSEEHLRENQDVFEWSLSAEEMERIAQR